MTDIQVITATIHFLCIFFFLIRISKKLSRIENKINNNINN